MNDNILKHIMSLPHDHKIYLFRVSFKKKHVLKSYANQINHIYTWKESWGWAQSHRDPSNNLKLRAYQVWYFWASIQVQDPTINIKSSLIFFFFFLLFSELIPVSILEVLFQVNDINQKMANKTIFLHCPRTVLSPKFHVKKAKEWLPILPFTNTAYKE